MRETSAGGFFASNQRGRTSSFGVVHYVSLHHTPIRSSRTEFAASAGSVLETRSSTIGEIIRPMTIGVREVNCFHSSSAKVASAASRNSILHGAWRAGPNPVLDMSRGGGSVCAVLAVPLRQDFLQVMQDKPPFLTSSLALAATELSTAACRAVTNMFDLMRNQVASDPLCPVNEEAQQVREHLPHQV